MYKENPAASPGISPDPLELIYVPVDLLPIVVDHLAFCRTARADRVHPVGWRAGASGRSQKLTSCRTARRCTDSWEVCSESCRRIRGYGSAGGRDAVVDLARRSVRWRVPMRWYLVALFTVPGGATLISLTIYGSQALASPAGGWARALAEVVAVFVLQLVLFQLAEEIGFTGFLQHHWQDRYHPMKLTLYVALLWALWHVPDHFAEESWGVEALISAPVIFAIEFVSLFSQNSRHQTRLVQQGAQQQGVHGRKEVLSKEEDPVMEGEQRLTRRGTHLLRLRPAAT